MNHIHERDDDARRGGRDAVPDASARIAARVEECCDARRRRRRRSRAIVGEARGTRAVVDASGDGGSSDIGRRHDDIIGRRGEAAIRQLHRLPFPPRPVPLQTHRAARGGQGQGLDAGTRARHRVRLGGEHQRAVHDRQDEGRAALGPRPGGADGRMPRDDRVHRRGRGVRRAGDDAVRAQGVRGAVRAQVPRRYVSFYLHTGNWTDVVFI